MITFQLHTHSFKWREQKMYIGKIHCINIQPWSMMTLSLHAQIRWIKHVMVNTWVSSILQIYEMLLGFVILTNLDKRHKPLFGWFKNSHVIKLASLKELVKAILTTSTHDVIVVTFLYPAIPNKALSVGCLLVVPGQWGGELVLHGKWGDPDSLIMDVSAQVNGSD